MSDYPAFGKIPRLHRDVVITEKIDGTNGLIAITESATINGEWVRVGSRNRWLTSTKGDDNHGFARWVEENVVTLVGDLGPGLHYGEWWGSGIGRNYGLDHKRFSLFNVSRWSDVDFKTENVGVVPVLAEGNAVDLNDLVDDAVTLLRTSGSLAAPEFNKPEGVIVFHKASNHLYKVTLEKDEEWKGKK